MQACQMARAIKPSLNIPSHTVFYVLKASVLILQTAFNQYSPRGAAFEESAISDRYRRLGEFKE